MSIRSLPPTGNDASLGLPKPEDARPPTAGSDAVERRSSDAPAIATHSSPTAERFNRLFSSTTAEAGQLAQAEPERDNDEWPRSPLGQRLVLPRNGPPTPRYRRTVPRQVSGDTASELHSSAGLMQASQTKQVALTLVNPEVNEGRLNTALIDDMIATLRKDAAWDGHETQRANVERKLLLLKESPELQAAINGICDEPGTHPKGSARDVTRATLNLPMNEAVNKIHARQEVVMALLGELHPEPGAAATYATAVAKLVHEHMPQRAVQDWKSLLERNHISIRKGNTRIQVPLNTYARNERVQTPLAISPDGRLPDGTLLAELPGMRAALHALLLQPDEMQDAIVAAVERLAKHGENNAA